MPPKYFSLYIINYHVTFFKGQFLTDLDQGYFKCKMFIFWLFLNRASRVLREMLALLEYQVLKALLDRG